MAARRTRIDHEAARKRVLAAAAHLFLEQGYTETYMKTIATAAGINSSTIFTLFDSKEDILCALVEYVFASQFAATEKLLGGKKEDRVMLYAAETVLQLHMTENSEAIRSLYVAAYSLPKTTAIIQQAITRKLETIFGEHLPGLKTQDFFMMEIASGGIMRGFMTSPCDMWFTMDKKVRAFLQATLRVYCMPEAKIEEAVAFVNSFDFTAIAQQTIDSILRFTGSEQE